MKYGNKAKRDFRKLKYLAETATTTTKIKRYLLRFIFLLTKAQNLTSCFAFLSFLRKLREWMARVHWASSFRDRHWGGHPTPLPPSPLAALGPQTDPLSHGWPAPCVLGCGLAKHHLWSYPHSRHSLLAHWPSPPSPTCWTTGFPVEPRQQRQVEGVFEVPRDPGCQGILFHADVSELGKPRGDQSGNCWCLRLHRSFSVPCVLLCLAIINGPLQDTMPGSVSPTYLPFFPLLFPTLTSTQEQHSFPGQQADQLFLFSSFTWQKGCWPQFPHFSKWTLSLPSPRFLAKGLTRSAVTSCSFLSWATVMCLIRESRSYRNVTALAETMSLSVPSQDPHFSPGVSLSNPRMSNVQTSVNSQDLLLVS